MTLPTDSAERKRIPLFSGVVAYFPDALVGVARVSFEGNEKHNPGQPLHWAREKSTDHEDCIARHSVDALKAATLEEKVQHLRNRAWRALASLQLAEEELALSLKGPTVSCVALPADWDWYCRDENCPCRGPR